jgi:hypothetical protein
MNCFLRSQMAAAVVLLVGFFNLACSHGGFDGTVYRRGDVAFRVPAAPATWKRLDVENGTLAFRDTRDEGSILVNARCKDVADAPLVALTNQLLAGTTERAFEVEETIPFDGREARHTRVKAKLDGVEMAYDIYVLKKDGCLYDFVFVTKPATFEAGVGVFTTFVRGFHTLPGSGESREP